MGGNGELSLGSIHHRSQWCYGASLPSALCSRCSHVCETMEKKVIIGFFVLKRNRGFFYDREVARGRRRGTGEIENQNLVFLYYWFFFFK